MKLYLLSALITRISMRVNGFPILHEVSTTVDLGYATYKGERLAAGVEQYLGMRYAKPPLGDLRFRGPQDPDHVFGVQSATSFGPICVGVGQEANSTANEDCLFVNVFTPSNATASSRLPVWVYIQGGGYALNWNANYNGTDVIQKSGYNIIFVNFNYRVGLLGFLQSEKIRQNGDLNVGLLDQRKVLTWVKKYISKFGGDPNHVVIHGASAGGGSISHHLTAYGGRDDHLFAGAAPESPFWPTLRTVADMEFQFDLLTNQTGCSGQNDSLVCLRATNISTLLAYNAPSPFPGCADYGPPAYYWLPVIDGTLVQGQMRAQFQQGRFIRVPLLIGDDSNEGTIFAPNASSASEAAAFVKSNFPDLGDDQLDQVIDTYPPSSLPPLAEHAAYFPVAAAAYGEASFICAGDTIAAAAASYVSPEQAWNYRYNVLDPGNVADGEGVPHTFETSAIFGVGYAGPAAASYSTTNAAIVPVTMDYHISFVRSLNPNTYRAAGAPVWEPWGSEDGQRLRLQTNDTAMEAVPANLNSRCAFWDNLAATMEN